MSSKYVVVYPDSAALAKATAARLITHLTDVLALQGQAHVSLTGGTVGIETLRQVASSELAAYLDWTRVHLWWSDERFLPAGDPERNEVQAEAAWLAEAGIPEANIHRIPALSPEVPTAEEAAAQYATELAQYASEGGAAPLFDVLVLGMGPDAHVASLFPDHAGLLVKDQATTPVHDSPKPPSTRVSFTFETINGANEVWIVAAGAEKALAVELGLNRAPLTQAPVAHVRGRAKTLWLLDAAAAGAQVS